MTTSAQSIDLSSRAGKRLDTSKSLKDPLNRQSVRLARCVPSPDTAYFFDALFNSTN